MIALQNVTLTFPDGDNRITAVDRVTLRGENGTVTGITGQTHGGGSQILDGARRFAWQINRGRHRAL